MWLIMRHREVQSVMMATHVAGWEAVACLTVSPGPLPILPTPKREGLWGTGVLVVLHAWSWGLSWLAEHTVSQGGFQCIHF